MCNEEKEWMRFFKYENGLGELRDIIEMHFLIIPVTCHFIVW